ncbi:MAG TPA: response regulator [Kofleriaceae bacterium]
MELRTTMSIAQLSQSRDADAISSGIDPQGTESHAIAPAVRVLIIDDHHDFARSLQQGLELLGHRTEVAHDAPTALLACQTFEPEVALVDIMLPVVDGYDLGARLRERGVRRLIAVTGTAHSERTIAAGFDAHFGKPLALDELDRTLRAL